MLVRNYAMRLACPIGAKHVVVHMGADKEGAIS